MHCARAAYQAYIWRHAHENCPDLPSPSGNGWKTEEDGSLAVEWFQDDMMPADLVDVLGSTSDVAAQDTEVEGIILEEDDEVDNVVDVLFEEDCDDC